MPTPITRMPRGQLAPQPARYSGGNQMIVDLRTYTLVPGRLAAYLELYEKEGLPIQQKHLGKPLGYFVTEIGTLNQVVHLWGYESQSDRERRRNAMEADPDWIAFRKKERGRRQYPTPGKQDPKIDVVLSALIVESSRQKSRRPVVRAAAQTGSNRSVKGCVGLPIRRPADDRPLRPRFSYFSWCSRSRRCSRSHQVPRPPSGRTGRRTAPLGTPSFPAK